MAQSVAVTSGYPSAHRAGAAGHARRPAFKSVPRSVRPPRPANENVPKPWGENSFATNSMLRRSAGRAATALLGLTRIGARLNPYINFALLAWDFYEWYHARNGQDAGFDMTGWTLYDPGCSGRTSAVGPIARQYTGCVWLAYNYGNYPPGITYQTTYYACAFADAMAPWPGSGTYQRGAHTGTWHAPVSPMPQVPYWKDALPELWWPASYPRVHPSIDPMGLPIGEPVPTTRPLPWRVLPLRGPNPWRVEQSSRGYDLPKALDPRGQAGPTWEITADAVRQIKPQHRLRPAPKGTKERKSRFISGKFARPIEKIIGPITESQDWVKCFWDALPARYREGWHKMPAIPEALRILYKNFDHVDLQKAGENMIKNELEDYAFGKAGQRLGKFAREWNLPRGLQLGPAL